MQQNIYYGEGKNIFVEIICNQRIVHRKYFYGVKASEIILFLYLSNYMELENILQWCIIVKLMLF